MVSLVWMCPLSGVGCLGSWLAVRLTPAPEPARASARSCTQKRHCSPYVTQPSYLSHVQVLEPRATRIRARKIMPPAMPCSQAAECRIQGMCAQLPCAKLPSGNR